MASSTAFLSAVNLSFHPVHRWALGWVRLAAAAPLDSSVASLSVPSHSSFSASQSRQRFSDISGDSDWALVQKAVAPDSMAISAISADVDVARSEEHTSELQSLMRISYAVFCLKKKNYKHRYTYNI